MPAGSTWTISQATGAGFVLGAVSVTGWVILDKCNELMEYDMPDILFFPLLFALVVGIPVCSIAVLYSRMPRWATAFSYSLSVGLGMYIAFAGFQVLDYGVWKGFDPQERSLVALGVRHVETASLFTVAGVALVMSSWLVRYWLSASRRAVANGAFPVVREENRV